jgi:pimeloyl-ACP methyl ester carboxylesterase
MPTSSTPTIALVLLPGMDGSGEQFKPLIDALGPAINCIVVRYPAATPVGYDELEAIARAALPHDKPFILLGESFSGPIAVSIAASMPPQLKGMVLSCTFVRNPRPLFSRSGKLVNLLPLAHIPNALKSRLFLGSFATVKLRAMMKQALSQASGATLRARLKTVLAVDVRAELGRIEIPILYLRAARDRVVPRSASELILRLAPHVRLVEFDAPHFLLQASAVDAAKQIRAFIHEICPETRIESTLHTPQAD